MRNPLFTIVFSASVTLAVCNDEVDIGRRDTRGEAKVVPDPYERRWAVGAGTAGCRTTPRVVNCVVGVVSPLLANIYLHCVLHVWIHRWRKRHARGDIVVVRYADDFVIGFQYHADAVRFQADALAIATLCTGTASRQTEVEQVLAHRVAPRPAT